MAEQQQQQQKPSLNIFSHLPKFQLKLPFLNQRSNSLPEESVVAKEREKENIGIGNQKPNFVSFPNAHHITSSPIGVDLQEGSGRTHNPLIIWQVYAVSGFMIVKWVWVRWKERNERAKKSAEEDDNQSSDENNNQL